MSPKTLHVSWFKYCFVCMLARCSMSHVVKNTGAGWDPRRTETGLLS